ncbi:RNA polymerase sigma factor [Botrimarina sp.]|uniref:RNA polymerase sigma factor n=1 Tax=Botrimarina sp. TaxID=2795802 RepID=UPI0032ED6426
MNASREEIAHAIDSAYRTESRRVFATLVRLLGDFDLAEEALQEAFAAAVRQWPDAGVPENPRRWLVSAGRFKAIDAVRRRSLGAGANPEVAARLQRLERANASRSEQEIEDDALRLIFTCCHPAIDPKVRVPLTLREVCGMTTDEIARAFLVSTATMAQRIVRGKTKIRASGIPFVVPSVAELPERLAAVLSVIYLVFNEGYSASHGDQATRPDLSGEAIRLAELVLGLLPEPEVMGLLALMLLHESRLPARVSAGGDIVLLEEQDRSRWDRALVRRGRSLVEQALATRRFGVYTVQAAISAVHSEAATAADTDWAQIVSLYDVLLRADPSPVVELNRAVALAMRDGPDCGVEAIDGLLSRGELHDYHLAHAARADLCRRAGRIAEALASYRRALELTEQAAERRFLRRRIAQLSGQ